MNEKKILISILVVLIFLSDAVEKKCSLRFMKLKADFKKNHTIELCNNQSNSTVCKKEFTISLVSYAPHDFGLCDLLKKFILMPCCDNCIRYKIIHNFPTLADFLNSTNDMNVTKADFVVPIIAPKSTLKIYGYDYYPLSNTPSGVYITRNPRLTKVNTLLKACFDMWPLLLVCIAMAFIAGFITWLLDTWPNSVQFPRPFISGVLEGFWWSFISMTTVGYGDKSPLGWPARLFAMIWILIGIIICSLLTASITSALTTPVPSPVINSMKVGILENRVYDQLFVLKKKGKPIEFKDITELMKQLDVGNINGIFLDRFTWAYYLNGSAKNEYEANHFSYDGDSLNFGLLISDSSVSTYFGDFINDHAMAFDLYTEEAFQSLAKGVLTTSNLFDPKIDLFKYALYTCGITFFIIAVFGFFYEQKRIKTAIKVKGNTTQPNTAQFHFKKIYSLLYAKKTRKEGEQNEKKHQQQESENISENFIVQVA